VQVTAAGGGELSAKRKLEAEEFVAMEVPEWKAFSVTDAAEYLGYQVGHKGGTASSWNKPLAKVEKLAAELGACGIAAAQGTDTYNLKIASVTSYTEQLCPPTPRGLALERSAVEKTLHCPHRALPADAPFLLHQAGMRKFVSFEVRSQAAQFRTAMRTCSCWRSELQILNRVRKEYGPMVNLSRSSSEKLVDYSCWDTEAFADVLERAAKLEVPSCQAQTGSRRSSLQAGAYKSLWAARFPLDLAVTLLPRVLKFFDGAFQEETVLYSMRRCLECVRKMAPQAGWVVVRTWCNGWVTSSRVGAKVKPCIFGCEDTVSDKSRDSLSHYLACPALWGPIVRLSETGWNVSWSIEVASSLALASLVDPACPSVATECQIAALVTACDVFHTSRFTSGPVLRMAQESQRRSEIRNIFARKHSNQRIRIASGPKPDCELAPEHPQAMLVVDSIDDNRDFCEPECSECPKGTHHPNCSQYYACVDNNAAAPLPLR
jgi:hypothetical protein